MQLHSPHLMSSACRFPNAESWSEFERATKRETRKIFVSSASLFSVVDVVMVVVWKIRVVGEKDARYQQRPIHWQFATEAGNFLGSINSSTWKTSLVGVECISTNIYEVFKCIRTRLCSGGGKRTKRFSLFYLSQRKFWAEKIHHFLDSMRVSSRQILVTLCTPYGCRWEIGLVDLKSLDCSIIFEHFHFIFILGKQHSILSFYILCATLLNLLFIRP